MATQQKACKGCHEPIPIKRRGLCETCRKNPVLLSIYNPTVKRKAKPPRPPDDSASSRASRWNRAAKIEAILLSCGHGVTYLQARRWMTEDGDDLTEVEFVEALEKLGDRIGVDGQFAPGGARKTMSIVVSRGLMLSPTWGPAMNKE